MPQRAGFAARERAPSPRSAVVPTPAGDAMPLWRSRMLQWLGSAGACACAMAVALVLMPRIGIAAGVAAACAVAVLLIVFSQWQERGRPVAIKVGLDGAITWHRRGAPMRRHRIVGHARPSARLLALRLAPDDEQPVRPGAGPRSVLIAADAIEPTHFRELAIALARQSRQPRPRRRAPQRPPSQL